MHFLAKSLQNNSLENPGSATVFRIEFKVLRHLIDPAKHIAYCNINNNVLT